MQAQTESPSRVELRKLIDEYNGIWTKIFKIQNSMTFGKVDIKKQGTSLTGCIQSVSRQYERICEKADAILPEFERVRDDKKPDATISRILDLLGPDPKAAAALEEAYNPLR